MYSVIVYFPGLGTGTTAVPMERLTGQMSGSRRFLVLTSRVQVRRCGVSGDDLAVGVANLVVMG